VEIQELINREIDVLDVFRPPSERKV